MSKHIVIRVSENGYIDIFGPYKKKDAAELVEELYMLDNSQKDWIYRRRLHPYTPDAEDTVGRQP